MPRRINGYTGYRRTGRAVGPIGNRKHYAVSDDLIRDWRPPSALPMQVTEESTGAPLTAVAVTIVTAKPLRPAPVARIRNLSPAQRAPVAAPPDRVTNRVETATARFAPGARTQIRGLRQRHDTAAGERRVVSRETSPSTPQKPAQTRVVLPRQRLDTEARERRVGPRQRVTSTRVLAAPKVTVELGHSVHDTAVVERRVVSRSRTRTAPVAPASTEIVLRRQRLDTEAGERRSHPITLSAAPKPAAAPTTRAVLLRSRLDNAVAAPTRRVPAQALTRAPVAAPAARAQTFALRRRLDTEAGERRVRSRSTTSTTAPAAARAKVVLPRQRLDTAAVERRVISRSVTAPRPPVRAAKTIARTAQEVPHTLIVTARRVRPVLVTAPRPVAKPTTIYGFSIAEGTAPPVVVERARKRFVSVAAPRPLPPPQVLAWLGGAAIHEPAAFPRRQRAQITAAARPLAAPQSFTRATPVRLRPAPGPRRTDRALRSTAPRAVEASRITAPRFRPWSPTPPIITYWRFTPPTTASKTYLTEQGRLNDRVSRNGNHLARHIGNTRPYAVLRIAGTYRNMLVVPERDIAAATEVYLGGHDYLVDGDTADRLVAAGYTVEAVP